MRLDIKSKTFFFMIISLLFFTNSIKGNTNVKKGNVSSQNTCIFVLDNSDSLEKLLRKLSVKSLVLFFIQ